MKTYATVQEMIADLKPGAVWVNAEGNEGFAYESAEDMAEHAAEPGSYNACTSFTIGEAPSQALGQEIAQALINAGIDYECQ